MAYDQAMCDCWVNDIRIYPVYINNSQYRIEINYQGHIHSYEDIYKKKPRFKKDLIWHNEIRKLYKLINYLNMENNKEEKDILMQAFDIIHERDGDKAKDYGDFHDSMRDASRIMTILTGKQILTRDFYKAMMSLKLARLKHSDKFDTYLDLIAYIASLSTLKDEPND